MPENTEAEALARAGRSPDWTPGKKIYPPEPTARQDAAIDKMLRDAPRRKPEITRRNYKRFMGDDVW